MTSTDPETALKRLRGGGPSITVEEAKQWYAEGWIGDDELDEALEQALDDPRTERDHE